MEAARLPWPALGVLLIRDGLVTSEELEGVLARQGDDREHRISSQRLGEALVESGIVTSAQIARLVAEQHELPFVDLDERDSLVPVAVRLPEELARLHTALPVRAFPDGSLLVVVADPTRVDCFDDIRRALGVPVRFAVAAPAAIEAAIEADMARVPLPENDEDEDEDEGGASPAADDSMDLLMDAGEPEEPPHAGGESTRRPVLGSLLMRDGLITADELDAALAQQRLSSTRRLGEILVARGILTEMDVSRALAEQHELPFVDLREHVVDVEAAALLPRDVALAHAALPISRLAEGALLVAVADPASARHSDELRFALGVPLQFAVAMLAEIEAAIESLRVAGNGTPAEEVGGDAPPLLLEASPTPELDAGDGTDDEQEDERRDANEDEKEDEEPVPKRQTVTDTIERAFAGGASAIHFTTRPEGIVVLARSDGVLSELETIPHASADVVRAELAELVRRPLVVLDVGERSVELRSAVLPTLLGDRVTFRRVERTDEPDSFLGLFERTGAGDAMRKALDGGSGLFVVCGPAESGRTTTLYAALAELVADDRAILTIENPVERLVPGADQTEVDLREGVTFASGLRTILHSDPDVVVVGEIVDPETARLATRAALAGHLVLTTLDAETASSGVRRLLDLGVEPDVLSEAVTGVVAQQLVRRVCLECRESYYASAAELTELGRPPEEVGRRLLGRGEGCADCSDSGHAGRMSLFEVLPLSEQIRTLVGLGASAREIKEAGIANGMRTLANDAVELCLEGVTTPAEVRGVALRTAS